LKYALWAKAHGKTVIMRIVSWNCCQAFRKKWEYAAAMQPDVLVVAEAESGQVGLAVDAANEVATIDLDEVRPAPDTALSSETADAFTGVASHEGSLVILLDLDRALPTAEYVKAAEEVGSDV
jgi:chemotaxis signal transduction protein